MSLLPNRKQWSKWTLPSKLTAIGALLGVASLLLTVGVVFTDIVTQNGIVGENEYVIPYIEHKEEVREKEKEIGKLADAFSSLQLSLEELRSDKDKTGTLVDFFQGVTDKSTLKIDVTIKDDGSVGIFYNKVWKYQLKSIELFLDDMTLYFVAKVNNSNFLERRSLTVPIKNELAYRVHSGPSSALLMRMSEDNKTPIDAMYIPLNVYISKSSISELMNYEINRRKSGNYQSSYDKSVSDVIEGYTNFNKSYESEYDFFKNTILKTDLEAPGSNWQSLNKSSREKYSRC